jgi:guanylate kinase
MALADYVLMNDDLATTVEEMLDLINRERARRGH